MEHADSWELPEHLRALRDTVRRFMEDEVRPVEDGLPPDSPGAPPETLGRLQARARDFGLWALQTPQEFGGAGLSVLGQAVVAEEAAKCASGAFFPAAGAVGGNPPSVMFHATSEQFERYARPIVDGHVGRAFTAITEASGGSDPARAIECRADRDGDHYVLNGTKMWTTHAGTASWGLVYARTGAAEDRGGISCFIVESDAPGLTARPLEVMSSYAPFELRLEDVRVPVANRIGPEGAGLSLAGEFLARGRILYAAGPIGVAQHALELAIERVKARRVFGAPLADNQAIQFMVADSEIELRAARLLVYQAAWNADLGRDVRVDASICKVFGTETAFRVVDRCVQMFGALGLSREAPLARWFRDLRVKRLGEGASEVQRIIVARHLLR
ncbi:MAG: acyl-CoA dehydrogenase family protein [Acidimicrobiales bacterium]